LATKDAELIAAVEKEAAAQSRAADLEARLREVQDQLAAAQAGNETPRDVATVESLREQLAQKDKELLAATEGAPAIRRPARQQRGGGGFCGAKPKKH
jgi:capsule polysaccharide export protein KpsE/RkpR